MEKGIGANRHTSLEKNTHHVEAGYSAKGKAPFTGRRN